MKLGRVAWCCLLAVCSLGVAHAQNMRKTAEASMVLTGTVEVNPDGSLHAYTIDQQDKVPADVLSAIAKSSPRWTFTFSAPVTDVFKTKASMLVVNRPIGDGKYAVVVSGLSLGDDQSQTGEVTTYKTTNPQPAYPELAINARVTGTVFLLLRIGRDGAVEEAVTEQVNLEQYGSQSEMNQLRKLLAQASLKAVKQWTFQTPMRGVAVDDPYWQVRIPVTFNLYVEGEPVKTPGYGTWHVYIPGPRQTPPWVNPALLSEAPDAMPGQGVHSGNAMLRLATPLGGT